MGSVTDQWSLIEGALNKKLEDDLAGTYLVVFENQGDEDGTAVKPDLDDVHLQSFFMPADNEIIEVGAGKQRAFGVYQVSVLGPRFQGKYAMNEARDLVAAAFDRGTTLTNGSQTVRIRKTAVEPSFDNGSFYEMPVTVSWHSDM